MYQKDGSYILDDREPKLNPEELKKGNIVHVYPSDSDYDKALSPHEAYKIYNSKTTYKNGHYIDSILSQEERDIIDRIAQEINKQLKSWDDVPEISEDHNKE